MEKPKSLLVWSITNLIAIFILFSAPMVPDGEIVLTLILVGFLAGISFISFCFILYYVSALRHEYELPSWWLFLVFLIGGLTGVILYFTIDDKKPIKKKKRK
jgi:hypothetical protein